MSDVGKKLQEARKSFIKHDNSKAYDNLVEAEQMAEPALATRIRRINLDISYAHHVCNLNGQTDCDNLAGWAMERLANLADEVGKDEG